MYMCQYCKGILKELEPFQHHKLFKCKCKNLRTYNWLLDTTIINNFFPVGYWMYIDYRDKFTRDKPNDYRFVFR